MPLEQNARRDLLLRRWADIGLLWLASLAISLPLWSFLETIGSRLSALLLPWGWPVELFLAIAATTTAWCIFQALGVNIGGVRLWRTNPPAWPLGVVTFILISLVWECCVGPAHASFPATLPWVLGAVVVFLGAGPMAVLLTSLFGNSARPRRGSTSDNADSPSLGSLADNCEALMIWLEHEEPVTDPRKDLFDMIVYAQRIVQLLRGNPLRTIGLIGPYGCGKSSILNMTRYYLANDLDLNSEAIHASNGTAHLPQDVIVSQVSGWGCREGTAAQYVLDVVINDISQEVDCLELANVPGSYQRALANSGGLFSTLCALTSRHGRPMDILRRLDDVLVRRGMRLVVFLEDIDRNVHNDVFAEIVMLLDGLKGLQNCSFVLAIGEEYTGQEVMARLSEQMEVVSQPPRDAVLRLIRSFREYCLVRYRDDIDPFEPNRRESRTLFASSPEIDRFAAAGRTAPRVIDALSKLLSTPRILKTCLRRTWLAWQALHGELDFDDLLVCSALRAAAPDAFLFIHEHIGKLRYLSSPSTTGSDRERDDKDRDSLIQELQARDKDTQWDHGAASSLISFLFPGWAKQTSGRTPSSQRILVDGPTDYWARMNSERVPTGDIRDQDVLKAILCWRKDRSKQVLAGHMFAEAILYVDRFADKVEQFGALLDGREVRDIAGGLFDLINKLEDVGGGSEKPGFIQLWRLSLTKEPDSHHEWVVGQVYQALRTSLRFANDIYYYWRHDSEHPSSHSPTPGLRNRIVGLARDAYERDPRIYIGTIERTYPWSTYHLIVYHGSPEGGGPGIENEDWTWFGSPLMQAWDMEPDLVLPQIVVLLTTGDAKRAERGQVTYEYSFTVAVAERVFGQEQLPKLMEKLLNSRDPAEYNPEVVARIRCCQAYAQKWRSERTAPDAR